MNTGEKKRKMAVGVLKRLAIYREARRGRAEHNISVMKSLDHKSLWLSRIVSADDEKTGDKKLSKNVGGYFEYLSGRY